MGLLKLFFYFLPHKIFFDIPAQMLCNVPAVCDVFAVAIKETEGFQQPQKCGVVKLHKGRKPDCGFTEPEPPTAAKRIQSC
jgi:hypothetical protein